MEIQILKKQGFSLRHIVREVGCAVNTIRRQLVQDAAPKYERKVKRETKLAPFEPYLRERVAAAKPLWMPTWREHARTANHHRWWRWPQYVRPMC